MSSTSPGASPDSAAQTGALELHAGALRLALRPDLGACIAGPWLGDLPVLVSAEPGGLRSAWPSGCFVLVPCGNRLGGRRFDHCFEGWPGIARLRDEALSITLRSDLPYLVVYTPQDKPFFCVEPISHVNNALNMADPTAHGVRCLAPGEAMQAAFGLDIAAA